TWRPASAGLTICDQHDGFELLRRIRCQQRAKAHARDVEKRDLAEIANRNVEVRLQPIEITTGSDEEHTPVRVQKRGCRLVVSNLDVRDARVEDQVAHEHPIEADRFTAEAVDAD